MWRKNMDRRNRIYMHILDNCKDVDGCLVWQGATSGDMSKRPTGGGYGRVSIDGATMAVHRVVYTHYFGIIPHKKQIDHTCGNRLCCNPDHLELVTHKENMTCRS